MICRIMHRIMDQYGKLHEDIQGWQESFLPMHWIAKGTGSSCEQDGIRKRPWREDRAQSVDPRDLFDSRIWLTSWHEVPADEGG